MRDIKGLGLRIEKPEWITTLEKAKEERGIFLAAYLALLCMFGKRRNEAARLKRKALSFVNAKGVKDGYLHVDFIVGKKKKRHRALSEDTYPHKKILTHFAMPYLLEYLKEYDAWHADPHSKRTEYLFPSNRKPSQITVTVPCTLRDGSVEKRTYSYDRPGGYVSPECFYNLTMKVNPDIWLHLPRYCVGSRIADEGGSEFEIAAALDCSPQVAVVYAGKGINRSEKFDNQTE